MGSIPGLPGIFIAAVFSGSLSTVSSGLNSMSAVLLQDIVKPFISPTISDKKAANLSKIMGSNDPKSVDPRLICPIFDVLCPYLPERFRKPLRFGIIHKDKYKIQSKMAQMITEAQLITLNPEDVKDQQEREIFINVNHSDTSETLINGTKQNIN
ncbi:unnamed protein product [Mytilus coruscus]|uniref:Uncharacterized protein n=1 Tax=Mytilus coruscus TaxID=42192 RepID=A0A6J8AST2_MYTCO|nr:unnamed protein product [Mytilus coruscus]